MNPRVTDQRSEPSEDDRVPGTGGRPRISQCCLARHVYSPTSRWADGPPTLTESGAHRLLCRFLRNATKASISSRVNEPLVSGISDDLLRTYIGVF